MRVASDKLVLAVLDSIVLLVAHVNDTIVRAKAISMSPQVEINFAANNGLNTGLFAVRNDLRINAPVAFIDAEDDSLASCAASAFASDTARTKVRFIQFDI